MTKRKEIACISVPALTIQFYSNGIYGQCLGYQTLCYWLTVFLHCCSIKLRYEPFDICKCDAGGVDNIHKHLQNHESIWNNCSNFVYNNLIFFCSLTHHIVIEIFRQLSQNIHSFYQIKRIHYWACISFIVIYKILNKLEHGIYEIN